MKRLNNVYQEAESYVGDDYIYWLDSIEEESQYYRQFKRDYGNIPKYPSHRLLTLNDLKGGENYV